MTKLLGVLLLIISASIGWCALQVEGQLLPEALLVICYLWTANITIDILYFGK